MMNRYVSFAASVAAGPAEMSATETAHVSTSSGVLFFCIALGIGIGRVVLDLWQPQPTVGGYAERHRKNG